MKSLFILFALFALLTSNCASGRRVQVSDEAISGEASSNKEKISIPAPTPITPGDYEIMPPVKVYEKGNYWMAKGIGESRDLQMASDKASASARAQLVSFLGKAQVIGNSLYWDYTLIGSRVVENDIKKKNGLYVVKVLVEAPKELNPKR